LKRNLTPAEQIKRFMFVNSITQEQLCRKLEQFDPNKGRFHQSTLSHIISGRAGVPRRWIKPLAALLGVKPETLI
jgi:transcriptional regulator with XRE-family HTH domain